MPIPPFRPITEDSFSLDELRSQMRGFYKNGGLFLSDSLMERRLLPALRSVKGILDAAVFGLAGSIRLLTSYSTPKAACETMFSFHPEQIIWKKGEHDLTFRIAATGDGEEPDYLAESFAGMLSLLFIDSLCIATGIMSFEKPVNIPVAAIRKNGNLMTISLDAIPEAVERFAFRPLKDKLVFNIVNGVDVNELSFDDLFALGKTVFDHTGVMLSWRLSEQTFSVKKEMQEVLARQEKPVESLFGL
ncbi:MAG: hypothetical protein HQM09_12350 [Candidatus Riflebacteria bacterium]|nr:hypothetical protein [Candidatus Riflebacteria bacterium]